MITILHFTLKNCYGCWLNFFGRKIRNNLHVASGCECTHSLGYIYKIQMENIQYKYNLLDTIYNTKELIPAITCTCKKENDKFIARFN